MRPPGVDEGGRAFLERDGRMGNGEAEGALRAQDRLEALVPMPWEVIAECVAIELVVANAAKVLAARGVELLHRAVEFDGALLRLLKHVRFLI